MNRKKRDRYILNASIHTLQIEVPHTIDTVDSINNSIIVKNKTDNTSSIIINPNKLYGDCFTWSDFQNVLEVILSRLKVKEYKVSRCDLRFDSYDAEHYKSYAKLNRYLISLMAITYNVKNCYRTCNLWSDEQISCAIKNPYFQLEHYDRTYKNFITSNIVEIATSRLEERSTKKTFNNRSNVSTEQMDTIKNEFVTRWHNRWYKALENIDKVHERYNDELVRLWHEESIKDKEIRFKNIGEFIRHYQHNIYCRKQLIELLIRLGYTEKKAISLAKSWKQRYKFEWFSKADIIHAINEIERATMEYFIF